MIISDNEKIKRMKNKLSLYTSYTQEISSLVGLLDSHQIAIKRYIDFPDNGAKALGYQKIDAKHPRVENMILNEASLQVELDKVRKERDNLNLDVWLEGLHYDEWILIQDIFFKGVKYDDIAIAKYSSPAEIKRQVNNILLNFCILDSVQENL